MPKKQYVVKDRSTNKIVSTEPFKNKMDAKVYRNACNGERPDDFVEGTEERFYVTHAK